MADITIADALGELDKAYRADSAERRQLKLCARCFGVIPSKVDSLHTVTKVFHALADGESLAHSDRQAAESNALCKIFVIAIEIGTGRSTNMTTLTKLVQKHKRNIKAIRASLEFLLMQLLIHICQNVTQKEFSEGLFDRLTWATTNLGRVEASTIEEMFMKLLIEDGSLTEAKIAELKATLKDAGKMVLVNKVLTFEKIQAMKNTQRITFPKGVQQGTSPGSGPIVTGATKRLATNETSANGSITIRAAVTVPQSREVRAGQQPFTPGLAQSDGQIQLEDPSWPVEAKDPSITDNGTKSSESHNSKSLDSESHETIPKIIKITRNKKRIKSTSLKVALTVGIVLSLLFTVGGIAMVTIGALSYRGTEAAVNRNTIDRLEFVQENVTQVLGTVEAEYVSRVNIAEDLQSGDVSLVTNIYYEREGDLLRHNQELMFTSNSSTARFDERAAAEESVYLLRDSVIFYEISAAVMGGDNTGWLFLFDDQDAYQRYKDGADGESLAWMSRRLNIGTAGEQLSTTINNLVVPRDAYYIIVAQLPAGTSYSYSYRINQYFLQYSDYGERCDVSQDGGQVCNQAPPGPGLWYILSFTRVDVAANPGHTHLSLRTEGSTEHVQNLFNNSIVLMAVGGVCVVIGLILTLALCCLCKFVCRQ